jgi:exopolyphosphatase/guanosine-5'-triphosphate,3'-diphosphate pyrophosphatase
MAAAVIDCGTNTFNLLIAEKTRNGFKSIAKAKRIVRLGSGGIDKKIIREDSIERAVHALVDFRAIISKHNVTSVKCVGTAAIRDANNSKAFLQAIYDATGFIVETIDGLQEAEYIYKGVLQAIKVESGNSLIMDIGGGSVEFILFNSEKLIWKQSFRVGGARLMETFKPEDPISKEKTVEIIAFIEDKLKELFEECKMHQPKKLIGSSGSFETFASMLVHQEGKPNYLRDKKHYKFTLSSYKKLHQQLVTSLYKERLVMPGMLKMRADMIVVASILLHTVLENTQIKEFDLSTYALKEGLIAEEFEKYSGLNL